MKKSFSFAFICLSILLAFGFSAFAASSNTETTTQTEHIKPTVKSFTVKEQGSDYILLNWKSGPENVTGFKIYKYKVADKSTTLISTVKSSVKSYKVTGLLSGTDYCFKLRAYYKADSGIVYSKYSTLNTYTVLPKITGLKISSNEYNSQKLTWTAVKGVSSYKIYYYSKTEGKYVLMGSKATNSAKLKCSPVTEYKYKIRAYAVVNGGKTKLNGEFSAPVSATTSAQPVSGFKESKKAVDSVTLQWESCQKATGYRIYQYDAVQKKYIGVKTVKNATSAVVGGLESAKQYKFKIKSYTATANGNVYSVASSVLNVITKPKATSLTQQSDGVANSKVKLSWTPVERASGYLIYVSDHKNSGFSLYKEAAGNATTATISGVKNFKEQYVKIKVYTEINGKKVYGDYSKVVTVYA